MEKSNVKAMREALGDVYNILEQLHTYALNINDISRRRAFRSMLCHAKNVIDITLSAPPRNCDVGTAEEQEKRFNSFCKTHLSGTRSICSAQCPCVGCRSMFHCLTKWSQMPYDEGGAK